jgi:hypothetical protein
MIVIERPGLRMIELPGLLSIVIELPGLRLWNPTNTREHHMVRAKRNAQQKAAAWAAVKAAMGRRSFRGTAIVQIVRQGPRALDDDGATASAKWIRDGVAYALGLDDADPRIRFAVSQERRKGYGVRIELEELT